jgi:hypothetical protein
MYAYIPEVRLAFPRECACKRIGPLLFATHPHRGLHYVFVGFLNHRLLNTFTDAAICGMNRGNRCSYSSFPFPTYYPDTGTGSGYPNRTYVRVFGQPIFDRLREA